MVGDVAGVVGAKKDDGVGDLFGLSGAAKVNARKDGLIVNRVAEKLAAAMMLQEADGVPSSADAVIRAVRMFAHMNARGEWVNPPARVIFSTDHRHPERPTGAEGPLFPRSRKPTHRAR